MNKQATKDTAPSFFLITEEYAIGTPKGISASDRTIDISFYNLAKDYELQTKLHLASAAFLHPEFSPPLAYPLEGVALINAAASYLAAFADNSQETKQRRDYLAANGLLRILITDDKLMEELNKLQAEQTIAAIQKTLSCYERSRLPSASPRDREHNLGYDIKVCLVQDKVGTDFSTNQPIFRQRKIVIVE